jgi:L-lactate dehydrogenase complex protein LldE
VVRNFVDAFAGYDYVVTPSGSCAGSARHQHALVARRSGDAGLESAVAEVAPRVLELTELLVDVLGVTDVGASFPHTVTYHPTCHSLRMLGVGDRPLRLLRAVRGIRLVDLPDAESCCGFGGTFAVKNADTSIAMGADKARNVVASGAEVLVAGDSSCLMHVGGLLSRQRSGIRVMHLAEVLASTEGE